MPITATLVNHETEETIEVFHLWTHTNYLPSIARAIEIHGVSNLAVRWDVSPELGNRFEGKLTKSINSIWDVALECKEIFYKVDSEIVNEIYKLNRPEHVGLTYVWEDDLSWVQSEGHLKYFDERWKGYRGQWYWYMADE